MPTFSENEGGGIVSKTSVKDRLVVEERIQDVEPVLERNKALLTHDDGYSPSRDMRRIASVPNIIIEQWLKEGVNVFDPNCEAEVMRRLNSSDWAHLRTAGGKI